MVFVFRWVVFRVSVLWIVYWICGVWGVGWLNVGGFVWWEICWEFCWLMVEYGVFGVCKFWLVS